MASQHPASIPDNEVARLEALHRYQILDTPPDIRFDHATHHAAELFGVPLVAVSLVDRDRQWFKSCFGTTMASTPRDVAFCAHAILEEGVTWVADARIDPRFADNPFVVGPPFVRFYAAAPLTSPDGYRVGALCMSSPDPRAHNEREAQLLAGLATLVTDALDHHLSAVHLKEALRRAEAANHTKLRFLASMSHELRTPLNAIVGFSEIMDRQLFGPLGVPQYQDYTRHVFDAGKHLTEVIGDILDIARIDSGKIELDISVIDLSADIRRMIDLVRYQIQEREQTLRVELPKNEVLLVLGDQRAVRQSVLNLLGNAIKFTPVGGDIELSVSHDAAAGQVAISIQDNGMGIAAEHIDRLGEPFFRAAGSHYDSVIPGTGLGVSITKGLVAAMKGCLEFESTLGVGTRATIRLPTPHQ